MQKNVIQNFFSIVHVHPIIATSFSQDNSSEFSPIMPEEFGEHLIRDQRPFLHPESLQILQIHSSMTVLLLFSSPHSFSTGFRSEDWNGHGRSFILSSVTHFCVYFDVCFGLLSWWKIQTWPIMRFLTEAVRFRFFICWYFIESMMPWIWTRCSGPPAEKQAHNIQQHIEPWTWVLFIPVCCHKALFYISSDYRSQCHLKFQLNMLEIVFGWARIIFLETHLNNMWWCRGCLIYIYFLGFLTPRLN